MTLAAWYLVLSGLAVPLPFRSENACEQAAKRLTTTFYRISPPKYACIRSGYDSGSETLGRAVL